MEIVVRASIVFVFLFVLTRAMGKRELSETTPFELLMLVVIGDIIQQGVTQEDMSVTGAMLAAATIGLWVLGFSWLAFRSRRAQRVLDGEATVILEHGRPLGEALQVERLTLGDLLSEAREQGIEDLASVRLAVVEVDGRFSFAHGGHDRDGAPERRAAE